MTTIIKKTDDAEPWRDQEGKIITLQDCKSICDLAASLFLKELEFNPRIKESDHLKYEYEKARIIMNKMSENYERAITALPPRPRLLTPKKGG